MIALASGFLLTAFLYALVGFGGGSTYNALLVLADTDYRVLPSIALACNIVVVTGGAWHFARAGEVRWAQLLPFVVLSVPMAWLGGSLPIAERLFVGLLGASLLVSALMLLVSPVGERAEIHAESMARQWLTGLPLGAGVGFMAGIVGIGGGVFLAPVLHLLGWGSARAVAAAASVFILVNSLAGLLGQLGKLAQGPALGALTEYIWLPFAVLLGGQLGSRLGAYRLSARLIRRLTALLIGAVAVRLLLRFFDL